MMKDKVSFVARSEDGQVFRIDVCANVIPAGARAQPNAVHEGLKELWTSDGRRVNRIDKGVYEIVESGVRLTSDDPDAL